MNEHAIKALDAYINAEDHPVPHAMLIEGPWGSGKTHFLKEVYVPHHDSSLGAAGKPRQPFIMVSLFGARSADDVEQRLYQAAHPGEAVLGSFVGTVVQGVGGFLRVSDAVKEGRDRLAKRAIRNLKEGVLVLDDLERAEPSAIGEIMGLISVLVERRDRKVILIADEVQLRNNVRETHWRDWDLRNEKVIGRRIRLEPAIETVVHGYADGLSLPHAGAFLRNCVPELLEVIRESGSANLRNVTWGLHNLAVFAEVLLASKDVPNDHVLRIALVTLATTLALRDGRADRETVLRLPTLRAEQLIASYREGNGGTREADPVRDMAEALHERHRQIGLDNPPIDYEFILQLEKSGLVDEVGVLGWLRAQYGFGTTRRAPSWRRLWHSYKLPKEETEHAIADLAKELSERTHKEHGVVLHCLGLALKFQEAGDRRITSNQDAAGFFRRYVDDIFADGTLPPRETSAFPRFDESYGQLGFTSIDDPRFHELAEYLFQKAAERGVVERAKEASDVLAQAEQGDLKALDHFWIDTDLQLSQRPVLRHIEVERFARFMTSDMPQLDAGRTMLAYRYHRLHAQQELVEELDWARSVLRRVDELLEEWDEPHRTLGRRSVEAIVRYNEKDRPMELRLMHQASDENHNAKK